MTDKKHINDSLKNSDKNFNENCTRDKKQIIVDGVDVSECLFYQSNFEEDYDVKIKHFCSNWHNSCESVNNSNCYFKQLARKTQECENYKKRAVCFKDVNKQLGYKYLTIKQECEELKRKLSNQEQLYQNEIEIYNESCLQLRQENDDLYLERLALNTANSGINSLLEIKEQENDRYRKALEEIEEELKEDIYCESQECGCDDFEECLRCTKEQILDIISRAKGR